MIFSYATIANHFTNVSQMVNTNKLKGYYNMDEFDRMLKNVKATLSFEGLAMSDYVEELLLKVKNGELTHDEVRDKIKEYYGIGVNSNNERNS